MFGHLFTTFLTQPIYNGFIYLVGVMPQGDVGLAIIAVTLLIRIIFYPAFTSSIRTQMGMQAVQGELDAINKKYKDDKDERAKQTMQLFRDNNVKPLSGFLALLVQIPVFIALYFAFFKQGLPAVATNLLYPFVHAPAYVSTTFLGFVDLLLPHNIALAVLVGVSQYLVTYYSLGRVAGGAKTPLAPEKAAAQKMQQRMMLYVLPALMATITYSLVAAVGLYFLATNAFSLLQEWIIRRQPRAKAGQPVVMPGQMQKK